RRGHWSGRGTRHRRRRRRRPPRLAGPAGCRRDRPVAWTTSLRRTVAILRVGPAPVLDLRQIAGLRREWGEVFIRVHPRPEILFPAAANPAGPACAGPRRDRG